MDNEIFFSETQRFRQIWLWLMLLSVNGLFLLGFFRQIAGGHQIGDKPMSNNGFLIIISFTILLSFLFFILRLDTIIRSDGIYVRFFPIHKTFKKYLWNEIKQSFVCKYNPITEYGGWGLRWGLKGKAYNISGNKGIQLILKDNRRLLIGTNKPGEADEALRRTGHLITPANL